MTSKQPRNNAPATRLTQSRKREAKGLKVAEIARSKSNSPAMCGVCCTAIKPGNKYCRVCAPIASRENLIERAKYGRVATVSPKAQALRSATQRRQAAALKAWNPADKPDWLDEKTYREKIRPQLVSVTVPMIMSALAVSEPYAANIRAGRCVPHPRHWLALARLAGISG
jgi:hypothetical protein